MKSVIMEPAMSSTRTPSNLGKGIQLVKWEEVIGTSSPIIDLRSPSEFKKGSIPGAINIPLFSDLERHHVGVTYKSISKSAAVGLGLELLAARIDDFLEKLLCLVEKNEPLILHCWRGGLRSMATASLVASLGYQVKVLDGGYKAYRRHVLATIDLIQEKNFLVLMGRTGVGKTEFLRQLQGTPVLDFERYAFHRGSAFGDLNQPEDVPTQQNFENTIASEIHRYRDQTFFIVEIENYFGHLNLPKVIRDKMLASPVLILEKVFHKRISHIIDEYADSWDDELAQEVCEKIDRHFARYFSGEQLESLKADVQKKNLSTVVGKLVQLRYDPLYDRKLLRCQPRVVAKIDVTHSYQQAMDFLVQYEHS